MASLVTSKSTHLMYESSDAAEVMPEIDGGHTGPLYTEWRKRETLRIQRAITSAVITAEEENSFFKIRSAGSFMACTPF